MIIFLNHPNRLFCRILHFYRLHNNTLIFWSTFQIGVFIDFFFRLFVSKQKTLKFFSKCYYRQKPTFKTKGCHILNMSTMIISADK